MRKIIVLNLRILPMVLNCSLPLILCIYQRFSQIGSHKIITMQHCSSIIWASFLSQKMDPRSRNIWTLLKYLFPSKIIISIAHHII